MKYFIGVDFSMNSTGVCIYHDDHYEFMLFPRSLKKKVTVAEIPFPIHLQTNTKEYDNYSDGEREKLIDASILAKLITEKIWEYLRKVMDYSSDHEIYVSLEGISYGSKGSSTLDIVGYQWILRKELMDKLRMPTIFSPQTIKKTAGGGRLNKEGMHQKFFEIDDPALHKSELWKWLNNPFNDTMIKMIKIDDMIDSYWTILTAIRIQKEKGEIL